MTCPQCHKPEDLCVCAAIDPVSSRVGVVILQHPQEQNEDLGTGWLAHRQLENSLLRVGLSWPSLKKVIDDEDVEMRRWAVLYLGSAKEAPRVDEPELLLLGRKGERLPTAPVLRGLHGLILIDGTWSQAKALWWRNPWLLKAHRLVLNPPARSHYGRLRREPRRESLAVIEAAAFALSRLEGQPDLEARILKPFQLLIEKVKQQQKVAKSPIPGQGTERKV